MTQSVNPNRGIAAPVVLMFITAMGTIWVSYSIFFTQDFISFLILLVYMPTVGVVAALLYKRLKRKV